MLKSAMATIALALLIAAAGSLAVTLTTEDGQTWLIARYARYLAAHGEDCPSWLDKTLWFKCEAEWMWVAPPPPPEP
jgi:hypothetical protein